MSCLLLVSVTGQQLIFKMTIAHDKGKLAVKQGRKAVSLLALVTRPSTVRWEIVWLPKAIGGYLILNSVGDVSHTLLNAALVLPRK